MREKKREVAKKLMYLKNNSLNTYEHLKEIIIIFNKEKRAFD